MHIATRQCPSAGTRQPTRSVLTNRRTGVVNRPEFAQVLVCLLQVVPKDRLELLAAITFGVDLVGPFHELHVHRRASALLIAERIDQAKPMLEEAEKALAKAQELGGGATATALRGAVTGQLAGTGGMMAGMRQGPRAFRLLDEALKQSPNDPLVALLNGLTRLNAPAAFGGGPNRAEPELRRAVTLFATHRPAGPGPVWGRVDALIWHAIALEKQGTRNEARIELTQALGLAPGHAWITRELLPKLDAAR